MYLFTRERYFQHSRIKFVSPRGHVISSMSLTDNGNQTYDLCDVGAMLFQLSYQATQLERKVNLPGSRVPVKGINEMFNMYLLQ